MGCGNSKPETIHDPVVKPNSQIDTNKTSNKNQNSAKEKNDYQLIDQHARKAPSRLKNSAEELVAYLSSVSKDPRMLARGFFVWSSENIKYDVDGFFGRAESAPNDAESVMKNGKSVCEGYACVFELLCSKAGIPVKKLSGFAKGYGYSPSKQLTLNTETDHAWNAVQLEGKWYLLDSTWGSGHLDSETNDYEKKFDDFYFLTDPKQFVSAHFPYMDDNLQESQKWQLLSKPLSLEEFNKNLEYSPEAFKIGVQAVSHTIAYFEMKNELQMTFKSHEKEDINFSSRLMYKEGNWLTEQRNATFGYQENDVYKILVHPQKPGMYQLSIFGKLASNDRNENIPHVLEYSFKCTEVTDKIHEYPLEYKAASVEKCILHEPRRGNLPSKTKIQFRISAPYLQVIRVMDTLLLKQGTTFTGKVTTPEKGYDVTMYGTRGDEYSRTEGLYNFHTV
ncbi:kyphoscoliosis peptidase-like [Ruditapes philippinarum]|uniref:kyphoscoliosis peptidase-like n=1 Tax=Ruditapes philippinarum TaxID=129788 RepID=UPI00295AF05B|nr:kyphoscoliosis peptidase-like [Ruditapes philippinarum]XP_060606621.1 kyphoscoliosis peptidase-like [Ruditapes philippinarum]